jgi:hypothetical protein
MGEGDGMGGAAAEALGKGYGRAVFVSSGVRLSWIVSGSFCGAGDDGRIGPVLGFCFSRVVMADGRFSPRKEFGAGRTGEKRRAS